MAIFSNRCQVMELVATAIGMMPLVMTGTELMAEKPKPDLTFKKRAPTFYLIIAGKLFKGASLLLLACGVYRLAGADLSEAFDHLVRYLCILTRKTGFSPISAISSGQITPINVRWVATGTFLYSLFSLVEGLGLIFRAPWAGWLTIGESAFFIPIEIYELMRKVLVPNPPRARNFAAF